MTAYSNAYLGGDADTAFATLSPRCQTQIGRTAFKGIVSQAAAVYGKVPIRSYSAKVSGDRATVTYGYDVVKLNQTNQPWRQVRGEWRYDSC